MSSEFTFKFYWIEKPTILAVYSSRIQNIANFTEVAEKLLKNEKALFGTFSLSLNDWSGPDMNLQKFLV